MSERQPLWTADADRRAQANITQFLRWLEVERGRRFADYGELWRWSVDELEDFWAAVWEFYEVRSSTAPGAALSDREMPGAQWFAGARLNYAEHVLARAPAAAPAIVHVAEGAQPTEIDTEELRLTVGALAATLRALGVGRGDRVVAYLPNIPEAVIAMLAVTSLGAIWAACAPDFGTASVIDRFAPLAPKVLIAVDGYRWAGTDHDRRAVISELRAALPSLSAVIVVPGPDGSDPPAQTMSFAEATRSPEAPRFEPVAFADPLWILFSSGTTGLPKGIVHSHGGILLEHLKALGLCLDLHPGDRYLFFSSTSWMAWNLMIGGLLHGSTIVLYSGSPTHPGVDGLWRIAAATRATVLGMGSAYVTGCEKAGADPAGQLDLGPLRIAIPTGSPLPPSGWRWLHGQLGAGVRIDSICGGTDVCTAFFGGSELLPVHLGEISCRWLGIDARAFSPDGEEVVDGVGEFVITAPMPSMPVGFWNDPDGERYRSSYFEMFPRAWRQGDWIAISGDGAITVSGRSDATLNRGGVRVGSAEIYAVVERLPEIADSLVVGVELDDGGYYMPLFVVPTSPPGDELEALIARAIREQLSPRYVPDDVIAVAAIPRTLTGKKLEVPVKRVLQGVAPADAAAAGSVTRFDVLESLAELARRRTHAASPTGG